MYASLKTKESQKKKGKTRQSIEEGIPEIPRLSDFQVSDFSEAYVLENASDENTEPELTNKLDQLELEEKENEEEEKKFNCDSQGIDIEGQLSNRLDSHEELESHLESSVQGETAENEDAFGGKISDGLECEIPKSALYCDISSSLKMLETNSLEIMDACSSETEKKYFVDKISEPSAPAGDISELKMSGKQINENRLLDTAAPLDISKFNFTETLQDSILPCSDEKLNEYYFNPELKESQAYTSEFINQENINESKNDNKFYRLLTEYMLVKNRLKESEGKINELRENLRTCNSALWTVYNDVKVTGKEKCSDGNIVTFVQTFTQAQFNVEILKDFTSLFTVIKNQIYEVHSMNSYKCSLLKLKIEYYLQSLLSSCPEFTDLEEDSSATLSSVSSNSHFQQCLMDLKIAINSLKSSKLTKINLTNNIIFFTNLSQIKNKIVKSFPNKINLSTNSESQIGILFLFQRKQSLDVDNQFLKETRLWLSDLVAVLLRVGSWKEHIFLLNHIMRCPGGVSEWAAEFVQLPFSESSADPFRDPQLNHVMSVMNILLSPIEQRENFIKKWESELTSEGNQWTVIDSDGEAEDEEQHSCPLKENDLVSFLNQIPFTSLFKTVLKCDGLFIASNYGTVDYLLKLFSFLTNFIKILASGLKLYSTQRYKQFTKRLGRLIYHIVQYATDILVAVKCQISETEMARIQAEYDNFFLRSARYIYSAKKHGTWQFLATMPYHMPSSNAIFKLYGILQLNDVKDDRVVQVDFSKFSEKFLELPEEEQFYLLTTFANMALARGIAEIQFIKYVLLQLMFTGFLNQSTMDHCYKNVRALLSSFCSSHPFLMSEILRIQQNNFLSNPNFDQQLSLNLWTKLPVDTWQPEKSDLEILLSWLLEPINSWRNELARLILQSLNYGMNKGELFIPAELQYQIALMILQISAKISEGTDAGVIKNVSNFVLYQNPDQPVNDWAWNIFLQLRLHLLDKSDAEMCKIFYNLSDYLRNVPDLESNIELHHLVLKNHPAACFVALATTTLGHSVPIICEKGFDLIEVLFNLGKYEPGLSCLEHIMMMFLDCSDSLYKCEKFIALLSRLVVADNTYTQFAKNLISNNFPGPILKSLECMMQSQLNRWKGFNFVYFSGMIKMWLLSLTRIPQWNEEKGVLYLIDRLLQNSFFDGASIKMVTAVLQELLEAQSPTNESRSFSLVGWMNSKYTPPSLLSKGFNGEVPWFSYLIIQMEHEMNERNNSVWIELLKELCSSGVKKINVDNSLKKVCGLLRIPVRSSNVLAIYKWTYQILETDCSHPLLPLIWQRFFFLYFYRVPGLMDAGSVGEKFFDGVINQGLFKRLKGRLQETCDYFKTECENSEDDIKREYYSKCYNLFQTFSVWLHDPNLHKPCLSLHMLPIQYNPELLGLLIHGSEMPWIEYLEYQNIEKSLKNIAFTWLKLKNRQGGRNRGSSINYKKEKLPGERLNERLLNSYENPLPPPRISLKRYAFARVNLNTVMNTNNMTTFVKPLVQVLLDYINEYTTEINEFVSLSCDIQELIPHMYASSEASKFLKGHCNGVNKVVNGKNVLYSCSGPAMIKLQYQESNLNEVVKTQLGKCWKSFEDNMEKAMAQLPRNVTSATVLIDIAIEMLNHEYQLWGSRKEVEKIVSDLKETGVNLFDFLVRTWSKRISNVPPLEMSFENYIEVLAKSFIECNPDANNKLLDMILTDKMLGDKVCKYFTPNSFSTYDFIGNYSKAINFLSEKRFVILSKFDLKKWLSERKPRYSDRSRLISVVGKGLKSLSGTKEDQEVLKLLNQHLETLLMYDFPEHYGEVLNFLLDASESESISTSTWFTFLNALAMGQFTIAEGRSNKNIFEPGQPMKKLKHYFSKYAAEQSLLPFDVIKGTINVLGELLLNLFPQPENIHTENSSHLKRLKLGTMGLYTKYRAYVEPLFIFFGMLSYSFVTKAVEIDTGSLSDKLAQQLWPLLRDLYSPWLVPYWVENSKEQTTPGIQQQQHLESSVVLPWLLNDSCHASFCASIFAESIRFLFDALPGLNHVLSYTWFFYVTNFAHVYVKDYIFSVIHDSLLSIPWDSFFPSLQDVELMLKVVDQFLPLTHSFLGNIFVNIKWTELVHYFLSMYDLETTTKLHICLLHLLVKLPLEPSLKQSDKVIALLTEANGYAWHLVDSFSYETVLNWFIMSCDPRIILMDERLDYYKLDSTILRLLQVCAGHVPFVKSFHPTTLSKRLIFVRTCVKWLITSNKRFKSKESPLFKSALTVLWNDMETVLSECVPPHQRLQEADTLLSEFLMIFSEPDLCPTVENALSTWLSTTRKSQVVVSGLFRAAGATIDDAKVFGSVIESSLESYFDFSENCNWNEVTNVLLTHSKSESEGRLEKVLIDNNCFLTLHGVLLKRISKGNLNFQIVLTDLLQLLPEVKLSANLEPKLILLIIFGLKLAENEMKNDSKEGISYLVKFFNQLKNFINDKGNGFLSAIGLKKSGFTNKFRLCCLVACSGIIVLIKTNHSECLNSVDEKVLQSLEVAEDNKIYQNVHEYASYSKTAVKNISTVEDIVNLLKHIGVKLFNKLYLK